MTSSTGASGCCGSCSGNGRQGRLYTAQQLTAVQLLVDDLCTRFGIRRQTPADALQFSADLYGFQGVVAHNHVRADKHDLHPGFDWAGLKTHCGLANV